METLVIGIWYDHVCSASMGMNTTEMTNQEICDKLTAEKGGGVGFEPDEILLIQSGITGPEIQFQGWLKIGKDYQSN